MKPRSVHLFLAAVGVLHACPTMTRAASAPDSAQIAALQFALHEFGDIRVVTRDAELFGHHATVSPFGFRLRDIPEHEPVSLETPPQQQLVPWEEIESIHVRRRAGAGGVVVGALVGLTIGSVIALAEAASNPDAFNVSGNGARISGAPVLVGMLGGAAIGAWIDHPWPGPWQPVYP